MEKKCKNNKINFKVKKGNNTIDKILLFIIKKIIKKGKPTEIVDLNDNNGIIPNTSIVIGNHSGASGPMTYRAFLTPPDMMTWGAHQMLEGYASRRRYLIDVFYGKKLKFSKARAWISGTLFAMVSKLIYKSGGILPVYYDTRLRRTYDYSMQCLNNECSVLIFPENSDNGYKEVLEDEFHPGYIRFAKVWARKNVEKPIYTVYYSKKHNKMVIGKPFYVSQLENDLGEDGVNEFFRNYMNEIGRKYVLSK